MVSMDVLFDGQDSGGGPDLRFLEVRKDSSNLRISWFLAMELGSLSIFTWSIRNVCQRGQDFDNFCMPILCSHMVCR